MPISSNIPGALEIRRNQIERIDSVTGGVFETSFFVRTDGLGEANTNLSFPCRFVEMPIFTRGWSMLRNQRLLAGTYPNADCGVFVWNQGFRSDTGAAYYDGATMAFSITGGAGNLALMWHLSFRGKAIRSSS